MKADELQSVQLEQGDDDDDDDERDDDPLSSAPEGFQTAIARVAIESIGFKMLLLDEVRRAVRLRCSAALLRGAVTLRFYAALSRGAVSGV